MKHSYPADVGDYAKTFAVLAVMLQSILTLVIQTAKTTVEEFTLGGIYELVKYAAPMFIFGILYSTIRTNPNANLMNYPLYMRNRWHMLFVPSIWWTLTYLVLTPQLQQGRPYHNLITFFWQFINGNAAAHLWYNIMMLQFIIITPLFWWIARWVKGNARRGWLVFIIALVFQACWHIMYELQVFHGPHSRNWYLLDRVFPSFIVFAVLGTLLWSFHQQLFPFLIKFWWLTLIAWGLLYLLVTRNFFNFGLPVRLANAPYYLPSMIFYNITAILAVTALHLHHIHDNSHWLAWFHHIADFAHRAYLSHVFWLYWIWSLGKSLWLRTNPFLLLIILYLLTVACSFASAYGFHKLWFKIKATF